MQRRILVTALLVLGATLAACSGRSAKPEVRPVQVPQIGVEEPAGPQGAGAGAQSPAPQAPSTGAGIQAPEPATPAKPAVPAKAPAPADPAPAVTYPATAPAVANVAGFVGQLQAAKWDLKAVQALLPPAEGSYRNNSGEEPNYREHAYDGGALRLFEGAGKESLFAVVVDTGRPGYEAFRDLKPAPGMQVEYFDPYVVVIRAHEGGAPAAPQGGKVNLEALVPTIGQPTFSAHLHGVGTYIYYYVPEGVQLNGSMKEAEVIGKSGADLRRSVAAMLAGTVRTFTRGGPNLGRTSPDGKHWAGKLESGGYWNNWIVVRTAGQAEQRYQAGYFIADFYWLDDHRIVYGEKPMGWNDDLVIIDVNDRTNRRAKTPGRTEFGVVAPGKIWYKDDQGAHHEIEVP